MELCAQKSGSGIGVFSWTEKQREKAMNSERFKPFLKWAGGKRWLTERVRSYFPSEVRTYYEPFLGGGAVFCSYSPSHAMLSDKNEELMNAYIQVRDNVDEVIRRLRRLKVGPIVFERVRRLKTTCDVDRAVRLIYLNRTAFNGLYRVNRAGLFNVPFGCKPGTVVCEEGDLWAASNALRGVQLEVGDFISAFATAEPGDVIYADPPYTSRHGNNGFIRYNEMLFSWMDQERLANAAREAADRGGKGIVSNAFHKEIRQLYRGFAAVVARRGSYMSAKTAARGEVREYLLISD